MENLLGKRIKVHTLGRRTYRGRVVSENELELTVHDEFLDRNVQLRREWVAEVLELDPEETP